MSLLVSRVIIASTPLVGPQGSALSGEAFVRRTVGNKGKGRSGGTVFCPYCGLRRPATGFNWHMAVEHGKFANSPGEDHRKRLQSESGGGGKPIVSQPRNSGPVEPHSLQSNRIPKQSDAPHPAAGKAPLSGGIPKPTTAQIAKSNPAKNDRPSSEVTPRQSDPPIQPAKGAVVVAGVSVPPGLLGVVHGCKYVQGENWILTSKRGMQIGVFTSEAELDSWWRSFQSSQGRSPEPCVKVDGPCRRPRQRRKNSSSYGSSVAYWRDRIGAPHADGDKIRPGPGWVGQY